LKYFSVCAFAEDITFSNTDNLKGSIVMLVSISKLRIRKVIILFVLCAVFILYTGIITGLTEDDKTELTVVSDIAKAELSMGILIDSNPVVMVFTIKNTGTRPITTSEFFEEPNTYVIITPDGRQVNDAFADVRRIIIGPQETRKWEVMLSEIYPNIAIAGKEPGLYRLTWVVIDLKTKQQYKSNGKYSVNPIPVG